MDNWSTCDSDHAPRIKGQVFYFKFFTRNRRVVNNLKMAENIPQDVINQLKSTNGQVITCKAAVAWEAKKPLDITDIQVSE